MPGTPPAGNAPLPPLRWFNAADVLASMPPLDEQLSLAERTMTALAQPGASQLPAKIGIHPRADASFGHAMPAHLRAASVRDDLVGMKWVTGFPSNGGRGLPAISAVVIVNDPETGQPVAILDGAPITAARTAAISGVAIRRFGPGAGTDASGAEVAIIGAGVQGRSHLPVLERVCPGSALHIFDRHPDRAAALADAARQAGMGRATVHESARSAVRAADVIVTAASFGPAAERQSMTNEWLRPHATVVPVDYATYCSADVARGASLFLVDDREQFLANRDAGSFEGYPDPTATIGEAILEGTPRPPGRVVVTHLGVGLADLVFSNAVVRTATAAGRGTILAR